MHPTVTIKADRTICDLECMLPTGSGVPEKVAVVKPCKLTMPCLALPSYSTPIIAAGY